MKGLDNIGNSCYFNCALQCLLQVPQISNYLILRNYNGECKFTREYQKTVRSVWLKKGSSENPEFLFNLFKRVYTQFDNLDQQDSQEAFLCLLDILDKPLSPFLRKVFYGDMIQETVCPSETTKRFESSPVTIIFTQKETLEEALSEHQSWSVINGFEDSKGKIHHVATTRTLFWDPPSILMLSFKMYNHKHNITVPEQLDLSPWIHTKAPNGPSREYELFATSTHHGSQYSGHYVAYVKHKGQWYLKNDDLCMKTIFPSKGFHYFVLYKRVNSSH